MTRRRWLALGVVIVAVAVAVAVALIVTRDDSGGGDSTTTTTSLTGREADIAAAVKRANVHIDGVSDANVQDMITSVCDANDANALAAKVVALGITTPEDIRNVVEGSGHGAEQLCPDVASQQPSLLNDVYNAALALTNGPTTTA
jgi:hypothetical protein